MKTIERLTIDRMRNLPSELQQQVLTFAEFLEFKQQQLEAEGLLRSIQETKNDEIIDLVNARLYLNRQSTPYILI
jgi:hypothetical protein